ncbi:MULTISPECIES: hypothetical protein [unclassified Mycobacterium]|uniref:hypothetical protein n=1 Tax=unclassified Mycobacterium TaxID=2642494 RepID=UPI0007FF05AE|nr:MULTISPECIES: hypothetical protein [unclassified Mycobacterium]OBH05406.1 hypothetical protein A5696_25370 [Mycobacterium sp. E2699]OBI52522.1 hypothetical protein A5705_07205 [Mycobacterium sp. E787]
MDTGDGKPTSSDEAFTAEDVNLAERGAAQARERAAHAGLSAAQSIAASAQCHQRLAQVQDETVAQGVLDADTHRGSAIRHRQAAADDRELAEAKRKESEADLTLGENG